MAATETYSTRMLVDVTRMSISKGCENPVCTECLHLLGFSGFGSSRVPQAIMPFRIKKHTEIYIF